MFCTPTPLTPALFAAFLSILESSVPVAAPMASTTPVAAATPHPIGPVAAIPCLIRERALFCAEVILSPYLDCPAFCPHFATKSPPIADKPPADAFKPAPRLKLPDDIAEVRKFLPIFIP